MNDLYAIPHFPDGTRVTVTVGDVVAHGVVTPGRRAWGYDERVVPVTLDGTGQEIKVSYMRVKKEESA